jgi:Big-like domain-containing protein
MNIMLVFTAFAEGYSIENTRYDVQPDKVWNIKFNQKIDSSSLVDDAVTVMDGNEQKMKIKVRLKIDDTSILQILSPEDGYKLGETYTLNVSDKIKDVSGKKLSKSIQMKFVIKATLNDYASAKVEMGNEVFSDFKVITIKDTTLKSAAKYWVENQFSEYDNEKVYLGAKVEVIISTNNAIVHFYDADDKEIASGVLNVETADDKVEFYISQ